MAKVVRQLPLLQHLQQQVEHIGMGLLDLVQQHHGIGMATHLFRKHSPLLESNVTWRCAHQTAGIVLFHEVAHIHPNQGILAAEEEPSQGLGQQCLSHTSGTQKDEGTCWPSV